MARRPFFFSLSSLSPCQPAFRFQNESECNGRKPKLWPFSALAARRRRLCCAAYVTTVPDQIHLAAYGAGGQGIFTVFRGAPGQQNTDNMFWAAVYRRRGTRASVSRREVLARSRGLSENRYDSFSFGAPLPLPARVALKKWGSSTTAE